MSDITELERRIAAALDRIGRGIEDLPVAAQGDTPAAEPATKQDDSEEVQQLRDALDAEQTANAQLEERVRAIREKQETVVGSLEAEVEKLRTELAGHDGEIQRIRAVNSQLRANNQALREANASGVGDPHLINKSMMAELEAIRSHRDADRAELDAILDELKPLVGDQANA